MSRIFGQMLMILGLFLIVLRFFGLALTDDVWTQVGIGLMTILFGWFIATRIFFRVVELIAYIFGMAWG